MIRVVASIPMGTRLSSLGKSMKQATAAICEMQNQNGPGSKTYGVAILYPDIQNMYFAQTHSTNAGFLWRAMYIASKMMYVCDNAVELAILIAGNTSPRSTRFKQARNYLSCDYPTIIEVREDAIAQKLPVEDIKNINDMLQGGFKTEHRQRGEMSGVTVQLAFLAHLSEMRNQATPRRAE